MTHRDTAWRELVETERAKEAAANVPAHDREWTARLYREGTEQLSQIILAGLTSIRIDRDKYIEAARSAQKPKWTVARALRTLRGISQSIGLTRGRVYHGLSGEPRILRRTWAMEYKDILWPTSSLDLHACYYLILASKVPESTEKSNLVRLLQSGKFYSTLATASNWPYSTAEAISALKVEVAKQFLFLTSEGCPLGDRPVAAAVHRMFPLLAKLVMELRRELRVSGLSDLLTETEGEIVLGTALPRLFSEGIPAVPYHDAITVPCCCAKKAEQILIDSVVSVLGFGPRVKVENYVNTGGVSHLSIGS